VDRDHVRAAGVVDAADVAGVDQGAHQLCSVPVGNGVSRIPVAPTTSGWTSWVTIRRRAARPRRSRGLNTSLRLDCNSSSPKTISVSISVGGTNAHHAPVRTEPQAIAQ